MTQITHVIIETPDPTAATAFYERAFGLGSLVQAAASDVPSSGFRGFTISLVAEQVATVQRLFDQAIAAGGTAIKPMAASMWGTGASVQAPDGTVVTLATSAKKDKGPVAEERPQVVVLLAQDDVSAAKKVYVEKGFTVARSFGKYIEFEKSGEISLALYSRKALAKNAGVNAEGSGSHRLLIGSDAGAFTDPSGFAWV